MNFTSPLFLIGFPLVCVIYRKLPGLPQGMSQHAGHDRAARFLLSRQSFLLMASWLFYMGGSFKCFPLLLLVTLVTYLGGIAIEKARSEQNSRTGTILTLVLVFVFGVLFFFKYFGFVQNNLFHLMGINSRGLLLPLPAGISFYSFQSISYCLDVYRGRRRAERSFRDFALFVSFFPQLVAGPIERADDLLPQLKSCPSPTGSDTRTGAFYILRGFFKKIVIADFISVYVSALFDAGRYSGPVTVLAGILFGFQIYADFSGYSDIALGAARLLGIRLHINFDSPYLADSIREFWRRWHITLTSWFTDYVYIPLGGSRRGTAVHVRNILIVFLLSGFWHGADWHFAAWGLFHGVLLSCSVLWGRARGRTNYPRGLSHRTNYPRGPFHPHTARRPDFSSDKPRLGPLQGFLYAPGIFHVRRAGQRMDGPANPARRLYHCRSAARCSLSCADCADSRPAVSDPDDSLRAAVRGQKRQDRTSRDHYFPDGRRDPGIMDRKSRRRHRK